MTTRIVLLTMMLGACARVPSPPATTAAPPATTAAPARQPRFLLKRDAEVMVSEPAPHGGTGTTIAYRYFDQLHDAGLVFRKRALHPGAANGANLLKHDEVYYVLSGQGELDVDGERLALVAGTAVFMYRGATIVLRQIGSEDLVLIIAYPPVAGGQ